jgi:hypothetical protein
VRNSGTTALTVSDVQSSEAVFSVIGETAFELAPGASQTLSVEFSPTSAGQQQANLTIQSDDSSRPMVSIPVSGAGVGAPAIAAEPETLDFASVVIGSSTQLPLTIHNVGGSRLLVSDMSVDQPAFDVVDDAAFQLDPATAKAVVIRFTPTVEGRLQATLSIGSNDPKWPTFPVALIGTAEPVPVGGPHIVLDPTQIHFGAVPVGQSARRNVTVKNNGTAMLTVNDVSSPLTVYTVIGQTEFSVAPSSSHAVTVQYTPTAEGAHRARLTFASNDPQQPKAPIVLSGTGTRCFVATAAYGSPMQKEVRMLRAFRDQSLTHSRPGRALVTLYYGWNNSAADLIAGSQVGRTVARWMLRPFVAVAHLVARKRGTARSTKQ